MAAVTEQPPPIAIVTQAAPPPPAVAGCPPGLEYLAHVDQVMVHQVVEIFEALTGIETCNKFRIMNSMGQQIYFAGEESSLFDRLCCSVFRGFVFHITDNNGKVVMRVRRAFKCFKGCSCCLCCDCNYFATIEDGNGVIMGHVSTLSWICSPVFAVYDEHMAVVAEIRLPCCSLQNICCTGDIDFPVIELANGGVMATIRKTWAGAMKSIFTKADNFSVIFPTAMEVKTKALLIGAVFIVDMMVFEQQNKAS